MSDARARGRVESACPEPGAIRVFPGDAGGRATA